MADSLADVSSTTPSRLGRATGADTPVQFRKPLFSRLGRPLTLERLYTSAVRRFLGLTFPLWERMGVHAVPVHFYYPIPDTRTLPADIWNHRYELTGIDFRMESQLDLLSRFESYRAEYENFKTEPQPTGFYVNNGRFQAVDAEVLYCMIRHLKPRRICEIGSGYSTQVAMLAVSANAAEGNASCQITAIEPEPMFDVLALPDIRLIRTPVEQVPLEEFDALEANDILFIDSSHSIRTGGDVLREYLEIIPRLHPGVVVHCHDIFLPAEYPRKFVTDRCTFWNEQYLVHALMLFNNRFEVLWAAHNMHLSHPDLLNRAFRSYSRCATPPSSFYIRRLA